MSGIAASGAAVHPSAAFPTTPDVVVIGAGAAGIAAALRLIARGKSVVLIEAADRIGGRAFTESTTFGQPYDHGCSWLQGPATLPHLALARAEGFGLVDFGTATEVHFLDGQRASSAERRAYRRTWDRISAALEDADDLDVAASSILPLNAPYSAAAQAWIGAMDHGVDFDNLSTADYNIYAKLEADFLVREGMGTLVALLGHRLPVRLGTSAVGIDWSGAGVRVETTAGTIAARACILTVSTGVLASGRIRFTPGLPDVKQQAILDVPMGLLEKIGLMFDGARFGLPANGLLTHLYDGPVPMPACHFLTFPTDHDYVVGFVGGKFGWDLAAEGAQAVIDFALTEFVKAVGSDARRHFIKGHFSGWSANPLTIGAYSAARPGRHASRATLATPVGDRIFFAGEAVAGDHIALMSGAHMSGERVADDVVSTLGGPPPCGSCDARHQKPRRLGKDIMP